MGGKSWLLLNSGNTSDDVYFVRKLKGLYYLFYLYPSLKRSSNTYFNTAFLAYFLGLMATIFVMHVFKHAQPALLYLVPACLGLPLLVALVKGDLSALIK